MQNFPLFLFVYSIYKMDYIFLYIDRANESHVHLTCEQEEIFSGNQQ